MKIPTIIKSISLIGALSFSITSAHAMTITAKEVDLNADGKVTEAEIQNVIKMHFLMMDKNGDNSVSMKEWAFADGSAHE